MTRPTPPERYTELIALAEAHYARQGFVKWSELAAELGLSRQRILQLMQASVTYQLITQADLERYRSESSRRAAYRNNEKVRRQLDKLKLRITLTPENLEWIERVILPGTTRSDLINTAITFYRTANA